jgi:hypothetical protein
MTDADQERASREGQRLVSFYEKEPRRLANGVGVDLLPLARASAFELAVPVVARVVYVTDPRDPLRLVPFAEYDEQVAKDKLNEAVRVFTSLGAARIVAKQIRRESRGLRVNLGVVKVNGEARSSSSIAFQFRGKGGPAIDPRPLRYPDEPTMDAACETVLRLGAERSSIEIKRTSQFDVDGELAGRLTKKGFSLGAGGSRSTITEFVIDAAFSEQAADELDAIVEAAQQPPEEPRPRSRFTRRNKGGVR